MFIAHTRLDEERGELLVLGLSRANRERLDAGQPIFLERKTHGMAIPAKLKICIFTGDTEETMKEQMQELIGVTTVVDQMKPA